MDHNYHNRDVEQFVKQNADQYRMYPSEKVWENIHSQLHTRRRWYGIGLALLLISAGAVTWVMVNTNGSKTPITQFTPAIAKAEVKPVPKKIQGAPAVELEHTETVARIPFAPANHVWAPELQTTETQTAEPSHEELSARVSVPAEPVFINTVQQHKNGTDAAMSAAVTPNTISITDQLTDNDPDLGAALRPHREIHVSESQPATDPLSIESVVNSYKFQRRRNKLSLQLYFTPTISYRKLQENKSYVKSQAYQSAPYNLVAIQDVNSVVTHKPDLGLELGISAGYQVNRNLKINAGLQFNVSRYDIRAFTYNGEVATIALNSGNDSVSAWTNYRNQSGYKQDWLQNLYFSVSTPIGAELKLAGDNKTNIGIAGTLQPTYILSDRAYLLSTDYKNYAEIPWLIRRWNLSTSIETFVAFNTGKVRWQAGPQIRYQLLSSFQAKYPVRENLFDYGLKIGVMLR